MRRPLAKWKWAVIAGVVLLIITLLLLSGGPNKQGPSVTFLTQTNIPGQGQSSVFALTNEGNRGIFYLVGTAEVNSNGSWTSGMPPGDSGFVSFFLAQGEWTNVTVMMPTTGTTWRVPVFWVWEPRISDRVGAVLRANVTAYRNDWPLPGLKGGWSVDGCTNYSTEISR